MSVGFLILSVLRVICVVFSCSYLNVNVSVSFGVTSEDNVHAFPAEVVIRRVVVVGFLILSVLRVIWSVCVVFSCSYLNVNVSVSFGVTSEDNVHAFPAEVVIRRVVVVGFLILSVLRVIWSVCVVFSCSYLNVNVSVSFGVTSEDNVHAFPAEVVIRRVVVVGFLILSVLRVIWSVCVVFSCSCLNVNMSVSFGVTSEDNVHAFPAEVVIRRVVVVGFLILSVLRVIGSVCVAFHCSYLNVNVSASFGLRESTPTAERLPLM